MKFALTVLTFLLMCNLTALSQTKMIINKHDGTADSINFADIKSITFDCNFIQNGDFSDSFRNWIFIGDTINDYHPEDPGRADFKIENGMAAVNIKNQGISVWSVILYQKVNFVKGASYRISFDAKADVPFKIISNVTQDGGAWTIYSGDRYFDLTNNMTNYSYQFTMSASGAALFQFCLGNAGTGKIYFDNIVIRKL